MVRTPSRTTTVSRAIVSPKTARKPMAEGTEKQTEPDVRAQAPADGQLSALVAPSSERARHTQAQLLSAAQRVFERDGYFDARVADIAAEAGGSHGSFYTYFRSKNDVFRAVMQSALDRIHAAGAATAEDKSLDPIKRIDVANRRFVEVYRQNTALMALLEQVATIDEEIRSLRLIVRARSVARVEKSIRRLQREGKARPDIIDVHTAAGALVGMVDSRVYFWLVLGEECDEEIMIQTLNQLWTSAIGMSDNCKA